jgi:hypothetical protein
MAMMRSLPAEGAWRELPRSRCGVDFLRGFETVESSGMETRAGEFPAHARALQADITATLLIGAVSERVRPDCGDDVGNCDAAQAGALIERIARHPCNAAENCDVVQIVARSPNKVSLPPPIGPARRLDS